MSVFFVAAVKINNKEKFQEYSQAAGKTFAAHGGQLVARGMALGTLVGESDANSTGIFRFPDEAKMNEWYNSAEYQAIVPLREEACRMVISTYSEIV